MRVTFEPENSTWFGLPHSAPMSLLKMRLSASSTIEPASVLPLELTRRNLCCAPHKPVPEAGETVLACDRVGALPILGRRIRFAEVDRPVRESLIDREFVIHRYRIPSREDRSFGGRL